MSAPLVGRLASKAADDADAARHRAAVQRAANVDLALGAFNQPKPVEKPVVRSSSGISSIIPGFFDDSSAAAGQEDRKRMDRTELHAKARAKADRLSDDAVRLLDLIVRADEAHGGREYIDAPAGDISRALGISDDAAHRARAALEGLGLIKFYDNGSGTRGFRPKV